MEIKLKGTPIEQARAKKALETIIKNTDNVDQIEKLAKLSTSKQAKENLEIAIEMFCK